MSRRTTPLDRLREAADRIRERYIRAARLDDTVAMQVQRDAANALGLEIRFNYETGEVTVSRAQREEEK